MIISTILIKRDFKWASSQPPKLLQEAIELVNQKQISQVIASEWVTVIEAISARGDKPPPLIIFKAVMHQTA